MTMPLDSRFGDNLFHSKCLGWEYRFAWLPHRCEISRRLIWLERAYRGTALFRSGDIDTIAEHRWHTSTHHLIWILKK